ncbi:MAG TPA: PAS domain S-box protein [Azospira sp.]|nr:PAS domain S-box protein [Azospira sp.]
MLMKFRRLRLPLLASLAGLIGFFVLLGFAVVGGQKEAEQKAQAEVDNVARLMEQHALAAIRNVDLVLLDVQGRVAANNLLSGQASAERLAQMRQLLAEKRSPVSEIALVNIFDARGDLVVSSQPGIAPVNIADRPHFLAHQQRRDAGLVISDPLVGRTTGKWSLALVRRLEFADGRFAGVVVALCSMELLENFYRQLDLGPHGTLGLWDRNSRLLARHPHDEGALGQTLPRSYATSFLAEGGRQALVRGMSPIDGMERLYALRRVGDYPLYVFAGMAVVDYQAKWRSTLTYYLLGGLLLSAVVLGLLVLNRHAERQEEEARQALEASEARYRLLLENLPVGIVHFDPGLHLTFCNERFAKIMATTVAAVQGLDLRQLKDLSFLPAMQQALAGGSGNYDGHYHTTLSDIDVWISLRSSPLRDAAGKVIGGIGIVEDVGARRRAEEGLRESERRFRTMADFTYDWEYWQGTDGRIIYMTPSVQRITGYPVQAFMDDPALLQQILHVEDRSGFQEHLHDAALHQEHVVDFRIVRRDGEVRWIAHGCQPVVGEDGQPLGRRVSNRDVTERKFLEAELQQLNSRLEARVREEVASNREKDQLLIQQSRLAAMGEMVHNIAHQWRQPLNALGLIIANIRDDFEFGQLDGASLDEGVGRALKLLQRMSTTIDDFRNFFRPDREPADFDLGAAVDDATFIMEASLKNNDIALDKNIEPALRAWGFPGQFSQAVLNLLANAKEVLQERHVRPARISLQVARRDQQVEVTVADNAGGVPPDILPHIFEPYFTTKEQGSGIGLYMTKMIVERSMHGKIRAENSPEGARFIVTVPLHTQPFPPPTQKQ